MSGDTRSLQPTCTRRSVVAMGASLLGLAACASVPPSRYSRLRSERWLGPARILATLDGERPFTEGPAVAPNGDLYFSEMRASRIYCYGPASGELHVFRENSNKANGLAFDREGRLLACEEAAGRITRTNLDDGRVEVLAAHYNDAPLTGVNDLVADTHGRVYFTARSAHADAASGNASGVYRLDVDGTLTRLLSRPQVQMPNGLAISHDQRTLYLIDSNGAAGGRRVIEAFGLSPHGDLAQRRPVYDFATGRGGDGMCLDRKGNLYVAAGLHATRKSTAESLEIRAGIHVISPGGELLAYRETPEDVVTNCEFGRGVYSRTLFVTCGRRLLAIESAVGGA